jgi:hypothetical protein
MNCNFHHESHTTIYIAPEIQPGFLESDKIGEPAIQLTSTTCSLSRPHFSFLLRREAAGRCLAVVPDDTKLSAPVATVTHHAPIQAG